MLARRKHPAGPNRLDDLCTRYGIDNSRRTKHGALLDAEILAEVYVELIGARQAMLGLAETSRAGRRTARARSRSARGRLPLAPRVSEAERAGAPRIRGDARREALWREYRGGRSLIARRR